MLPKNTYFYNDPIIISIKCIMQIISSVRLWKTISASIAFFCETIIVHKRSSLCLGGCSERRSIKGAATHTSDPL